jgi:hypothetical protein
MITLQYQLLNDNHLMITFYIYKKNPWWVFVVTFTGRNHEIVCRILFVIVGEGEEDDGSGVAGTSQRSLPQSSQVQVAGRTHLQSLLLHYILKGDFNWRKKRLFEKTFSILKRCNSDDVSVFQSVDLIEDGVLFLFFRKISNVLFITTAVSLEEYFSMRKKWKIWSKKKYLSPPLDN